MALGPPLFVGAGIKGDDKNQGEKKGGDRVLYLRAPSPVRLFFGPEQGRGDEIKVFVCINYGEDRIRDETVEVAAGSNVLGALKAAAKVEVTDESATRHPGSMVRSIDGFSNDMNHAWIYYVFERGDAGWRIPMEMPDTLAVSDGMRIGWRLCNLKEHGPVPKDGPSGRAAAPARPGPVPASSREGSTRLASGSQISA